MGLVAPFVLIVSGETGYFILTKEGRFAEPKIASFADWLLAK
jgi:hypothetical protein